MFTPQKQNAHYELIMIKKDLKPKTETRNY